MNKGDAPFGDFFDGVDKILEDRKKRQFNWEEDLKKRLFDIGKSNCRPECVTHQC
ncbi:hypothetical protein LCGC14_2978010, partial [marine sediment metagenome]